MMHRLALLAPLSCLLACDAPEPPQMGGQFGEETIPGCQVISTTPIEPSEVSELGFTAQEVIDLVVGDHVADLTWADGSAAALTLSVSDPGDPSYVLYDYVSPDGSEPAIFCNSAIEFAVTLSVETDDGNLLVEQSYTISATMADLVAITVELEGFDAEAWTSDSFDRTWAGLMAGIDASGVDGLIDGYGETSSGSGDSGSLTLSRFDIATFTVPAER